jgi:hypothetical protein
MRSNKGIWLIQERGVRRRTGTADRGGLVTYSNTGRVLIYYPIISKHLVPATYTTGTPGGAVASGSSLVLPRAAADTRGQYSTLGYTGASIVRYSMQGQQRGRRRGGEKEGRGNGGRGEGRVARNAGDKAAGAWVIGG